MKMSIYISDSLRHMKVFATSQSFLSIYFVTFKAFYKSVHTIVTVSFMLRFKEIKVSSQILWFTFTCPLRSDGFSPAISVQAPVETIVTCSVLVF